MQQQQPEEELDEELLFEEGASGAEDGQPSMQTSQHAAGGATTMSGINQRGTWQGKTDHHNGGMNAATSAPTIAAGTNGGSPSPSPLSGSDASPLPSNQGESYSSAFRRYAETGDAAAAPVSAQQGQQLKRKGQSVVAKVTAGLVNTYAQSNQGFQYSQVANPKRVLTKPSQGVKNEGFDNENSDLILYVGDVLLHHNPSSGISRKYVIQDMLGQVRGHSCVVGRGVRQHVWMRAVHAGRAGRDVWSRRTGHVHRLLVCSLHGLRQARTLVRTVCGRRHVGGGCVAAWQLADDVRHGRHEVTCMRQA